MTSTLTSPLSSEQLQRFDEQGFIVLPGFIEPEHQQRLREDVDALEQARTTMEWAKVPFLVSYKELGELTSHPPMMEMIRQLEGERFMMHHIHAVRQDAGARGVQWHHDYEQHPQANRSHCMVHVFYYLNGLNGEIGDLLVVPGTHKKVAEKGVLGQFGTENLPGSRTFDDLPHGTAIIVHSAVFHARRPKPGGEGHPRYFIDISYCERGVVWPGYGRQDQINACALENNLGRDGRYDHLYDTSQFFTRSDIIDAFEEKNQGSLCLKI